MTWTKIGTITGALLGLIALAGIAYQTKADFDRVAESTKSNAWEIIRQEQTYIDDRRDRYESENKPVPKWLKDRQRRLNDKKARTPTPKK